ncbi:glycosyltransferase family 9 protein [Thermocoleostomius sinensis]|uniref:Glycosyltransferase family 9 protein n=1 Tax=Thermocoleostomius sinensis A174 TaxID=2016057 RepID=A0A9E8ZIG2_9CYAN|nr:glycosyltransferase family 9 protein [Thermocoleostomius sinensis]WAL61868.1 glycosyltransferase family 9 protein [Thermocoleostomius sinensis A174]
MRVVALVPGGVSDQIFFFPTLDDLKRNYPNAEIDVVVEPRAIAAYRVCKSVDEIFTFDYRDRNSPADWANLLGIMRDRYTDVAISAGQGWSTHFLLWLTGIPVRIGYASGSNLFLTNAVARQPDQYAADMYHDLLQGLGIKTPTPELSISIPKVDLDWAEAEQKRLNVNNYVLICGGSNQENEANSGDTYPIEYWHRIVQDFQQRQPDLPLVVAETPSDKAFVSALTTACPMLKVTRPNDIGKLAAMIAGANLLLSSNRVAMQLAAALQVYTLALLGAIDSTPFLPQSDKFQSIQSTTGNLSDIAPEQVLATVWGG